MTLLKDALDRRGQPLRTLCGVPGLDYSYAYKHYKGLRSITAEYALKYERLIGIPRSELRPALWPPDQEKNTVAQDSAG